MFDEFVEYTAEELLQKQAKRKQAWLAMKIKAERQQEVVELQDKIETVLKKYMAKIPAKLYQDGCPEVKGKVKHTLSYGCDFDLMTALVQGKDLDVEALKTLAYHIADELVEEVKSRD